MTPRTRTLIEVLTAGVQLNGGGVSDMMTHLVELAGPMRANTGLSGASSQVEWRTWIYRRLADPHGEHPRDSAMLRCAAVLVMAMSPVEWAEAMAR